jgi:hypothetical protein
VRRRTLLLVSLPAAALGCTAALAFRLRLFGSRSIGACLLFVRLRRSYFFSARITPASLASVLHHRRQNASTRSCSSHVNLLQRERQEPRGLADVVGSSFILVCCLFDAGRLHCHSATRPNNHRTSRSIQVPVEQALCLVWPHAVALRVEAVIYDSWG